MSVSGASVSSGASAPSETDIDMALAYEGGGNFMARLQQLSDLKEKHDEALAELKLGQAAKSALDDAKQKQADAASRLDEANRTLAQAEQMAADIVGKVKQDAAALIVNANTQAAAMAATASKAKSDADDYAQGQKIAADAALKRAAESEAAAARTQQQAVAALAEAQAAKAAADDAKSKTDILAASLQRKIDALHEALNKAAAQ